jgi:hypothetical protein
MDSLQANDDDDLNFDKSGIQLRLDRLIEKQTKRYETLISSGNHGDAQRLLQIIWQLKQLRLPGTDEEFSVEQSLPPDRYAPMLEPFLKESLNDSQLSLLFDRKPQEASPDVPQAPPIAQMTPSMPEILNTFPPGLASLAPGSTAPTQPPGTSVLASLANTGLPPSPPPSKSPSVLASLANTGSAPNTVRPSPPIDNPLSVNLLQEPLTPEFVPPLPPSPPPPSSIVENNEFDDIGSGEFDIAASEMEISAQFHQPLQKISSAKVPVSDFEDESSKYDDPEAMAPLRGLTTGHVPVVKKEDLINYRNEVRKTIDWEEEEAIASVKPMGKPKTYLREKVRIKSTKHDEEDDDVLDPLDESVDFSAKAVPNKALITAAAVAVIVVVGGVGIYAFNTMSAPSFESLEKMGQQSDKSPFEMEQLYQKAVKASPKDVRGWSGLSYWQSRQGQNFPALESQANAVKIAPKDAKQWYALALLLKGCSNFKEALRASKEAVALDPLNSQYSSLQEQVQEYNP